MCVSSRADVSKSQTPQQSIGHILHVASHIFCRHRGLGRVSTAFGGGQRELLADGMQSAGGLRPVDVVVPDEESLLSPGDDGVGDLHGARSDTTNLEQEEGLSVSSVSRPLACGGGSRVRRWSALGQTKARTAQPAGAPQDLLVQLRPSSETRLRGTKRAPAASHWSRARLSRDLLSPALQNAPLGH